jgi:hypothetical protein
MKQMPNTKVSKAISILHHAGYLWIDTKEDGYLLKKYIFQGAASCDRVQIELDAVGVIAAGDFYRRLTDEGSRK